MGFLSCSFIIVRFDSLNQLNIQQNLGPSSLRRKKFENRTTSSHFVFVFEEDSVREIT